ncbi:hypothetical protein PT7_1364 [Pusillimonas sp. T7-7]|nr:hypothetical protein PT7_1364 [Pusillimonas sp. T7-7]
MITSPSAEALQEVGKAALQKRVARRLIGIGWRGRGRQSAIDLD